MLGYLSVHIHTNTSNLCHKVKYFPNHQPIFTCKTLFQSFLKGFIPINLGAGTPAIKNSRKYLSSSNISLKKSSIVDCGKNPSLSWQQMYQTLKCFLICHFNQDDQTVESVKFSNEDHLASLLSDNSFDFDRGWMTNVIFEPSIVKVTTNKTLFTEAYLKAILLKSILLSCQIAYMLKEHMCLTIFVRCFHILFSHHLLEMTQWLLNPFITCCKYMLARQF